MSIERIIAHIPSQGYQHFYRKIKIIFWLIFTKKLFILPMIRGWSELQMMMLYSSSIVVFFRNSFCLCFLLLLSSPVLLKSRFFSFCLFNLFPFSVQSTNNLFCSQNDYLAETYLSHYSGPCKVSLEYCVFLDSQISFLVFCIFILIASELLYANTPTTWTYMYLYRWLTVLKYPKYCHRSKHPVYFKSSWWYYNDDINTYENTNKDRLMYW